MRGKCPVCKAGFEFDTKNLPGNFPFCSERCKLVDLGRWIDGDYKISTPAPEPDDDDGSTDEPSEEEDE